VKKPRADSKIFQLKPAQRAQLDTWFREENVPYEEAQKRLQKKFRLKISTKALGYYWQRHFLRDRVLESTGLALSLKLPTDKVDHVTTQLLQQKILELGLEKDTNLDDLKVLTSVLSDYAKIRLKEQELALQERKVVLLEQKAAQADEANQVIADDQLTTAEKEIRLKEIFGLQGRAPAPADAPASGSGVVAAAGKGGAVL
jgi:hypothetical protein